VSLRSQHRKSHGKVAISANLPENINNHGGRVVNAPGDSILAEFPSVVSAVQFAVEIQEQLKARNAVLPDNRRMDFCIGFNLGDIIQSEDAIYGDGVNIAARIEALAEPGSVFKSFTGVTAWTKFL
jgi:adenylate cyclase